MIRSIALAAVLFVPAGAQAQVQAIVAATRTGASAAGKLNQFGTIEAGKFADLVFLDADPLVDIANIRRLWRS